MQYLDDKYPQYPLLPSDIHKRYSNQFLGPALCQLVVANSNECNYIGEKVIPDEKLPWVQGVLRKCFT
ncbi:hypothetical protein HN873_032564, partial [Arachis hypogaea]